MKPRVDAGQVWKSRDGGSLLKIERVDDTHAHGANPDGRKPRKVALARLMARGRNGYDLWEDAPRPTQADEHSRRNCEGVAPESCAAKPAPSQLPAGATLAAHTSADGREWQRAPSLDVRAPSPLAVVRHERPAAVEFLRMAVEQRQHAVGCSFFTVGGCDCIREEIVRSLAEVEAALRPLAKYVNGIEASGTRQHELIHGFYGAGQDVALRMSDLRRARDVLGR